MSTREKLASVATRALRPDIAPILGDPESDRDTRLIRVKVDEVDVYEKNPRLSENDHYAEILESVKQRGEFDITPSVTKRPGADRYILRAGAGTRFKVLCHLLNTTGDQIRYGSFLALHVPWVSEIDTLVAHGIENVSRSPLKFYELACMERDLRALINEEDPDFANATYRAREARYKDLGLRLPYTYMGLFDYALDRLDPHLHDALLSGMTRRNVAAIKQIETRFMGALPSNDTEATAAFSALFDHVLTTANSKQFDLAAFEAELGRAVAKDLELSSPTGQATSERKPVTTPLATPARSASVSAKASASSEKISAVSDGNAETVTGAPGPVATSSPTDSSTPCPPPPTGPSWDQNNERDVMMQAYRDRGHRLAFTLADDYGWTHGCFFSCLEDQLALGYTIECPHLPLPDTLLTLDAVVVHRELHAIFWSLLQVEIRSGRADMALNTHFAHASPEALIKSGSYEAVSGADLAWRLNELRLLAAISTVTGDYEAERQLVDRLDQLQELARLYAHALYSTA